MSQVVIGTAGHIDHGKTALVKALTGIDTDQLAEEKARGLTIDIGFAFLNENITIIDVPGHEKFIRNMVAGVSTIQIAMLVIGGDDGIMPQTREHLHILKLLGVETGLIALTKTDLVKDPDWLELVELDIQEMVKGTFLEDAPVLRTSINPPSGIEDLRAALLKKAEMIQLKPDTEFFRLPVDRVFNKKGFGTVITGTVLSGTAKVGSTLELVPGGRKVKIRGLQSHGKEVNMVSMGSRAALNLAGTEKKSLWRGAEICSPGWIHGTQRIIARISLINGTRWKLKSRQRIHLHLGTAEVMALVKIPGNKVLKEGESGNVILEFKEPVSAAWNDRFILRSFSPMETMGGGWVLDPSPDVEKKVLQRWTSALKLDPKQRFEQFVELFAGRPKSALAWAKFLGLSQTWVKNILNTGSILNQDDMLFSQNLLDDSILKLEQILKVFHEDHPYQKSLSFDPIQQKLVCNSDWLTFVLKKALEKKLVIKVSNGFALSSYENNLSASDQTLGNLIKKILQEKGFDFPTASIFAAELNYDIKKILQILHYLKDEHEIDEIAQDLWIAAVHLKKFKIQLLEFFENNSELKVSDLKTMTGTTRKNAIPLLEYCDRSNFTYRAGNLRRKGKHL